MTGYSRRGIKHTHPVGNRCKRILNISVPVVSDIQQDDRANQSQEPGQQASGSNRLLSDSASSSGTGSKTSRVESKLDLILKKMESLESKNTNLRRGLINAITPKLFVPQLSNHKHPYPKINNACIHQKFDRQFQLVNQESCQTLQYFYLHCHMMRDF